MALTDVGYWYCCCCQFLQFQENQKAAKAADSASGMHAVRTHLNEKRAFMKEWDKEHHGKWNETQVGWMAAIILSSFIALMVSVMFIIPLC